MKYIMIASTSALPSALVRSLEDHVLVLNQAVSDTVERQQIFLNEPVIIRNREVPKLITYDPHDTKSQRNKPHKHEYTSTKDGWKCKCGQSL